MSADADLRLRQYLRQCGLAERKQHTTAKTCISTNKIRAIVNLSCHPVKRA